MRGVHPPLRYRLFGLTVASDFALPHVLPAEGKEIVDIAIVRSEVPSGSRAAMNGTMFEFGPFEQRLAWSSVGEFRILGADRIEVSPIPEVSDALVALPLLGSVIATLLQRRGLFVLHASAAAVDGRAIALLGDKGAGKSTTAGALVAAGHRLLADDVVALEFSADRPCVLPAIGQLKLWDPATESLGHPPGLARGERLHPSIEKSSYAVEAAFNGSPACLHRLYVLRRGETTRVSAMSATEGIAALFRYSYMGRFGDSAFGSTLGEHFRRCALLADAGAVHVLEVPNDLRRLDEAVEMIGRDVEAGPSVLQLAS